MLEIITHGPNSHELRRDGVRVAVVDDYADARKLAAVDELVEAAKLTMRWFDDWGRLIDVFFGMEYTALKDAVTGAEPK